MSNFLNIKFENHKIPEFREVKNKDYIYFGEDNNYPEYLIELALRSAKHGAILAGKVNYIYGGGVQSVTKGASITSQALANQFIAQINDDGFLRRIIQDLEWFNGFFIEPIYNKTYTKLVSINYIPFNKMRVSSDEETYFYSNDWKTTRQDPEKTGFKEFKPFNPDDKGKNQLFYFKILSPKNGKEKNVYPVPEYIGACASIETDIEIANYHLNNIKTGFSVGTILNFNNGVPTEEAKAEIEKGIKKKFQGTDRAGSVAITFNSAAENAPTITSFTPNDLDKQFIEISKRVEQDIFTGHKITSPMLFGVKTEGQLGGRNEMIDAFELFYNTYIEGRQQMIEEVLNYFGQIYGLTSKIEIKRTQAVQRNLPDSVIQRVYDSYPVDQLAEFMGLPKVKKVAIQMAKQEEDLYEVLFEREFTGQSEDEIISEFTKQKFASELTANERAIIDLLSKDELMPSDAISKVLKISEDEVNKIIDKLNEGGYLSGLVPTKDGEQVVEDEGAKTELFDVRYKYAWRPGVSPDLENSRDKCKEWLLMTASQSGWLKREQINLLKNEQGLDVWESRGGWWNKNGVNVPFCRHIWKVMIVKKK